MAPADALLLRSPRLALLVGRGAGEAAAPSAEVATGARGAVLAAPALPGVLAREATAVRVASGAHGQHRRRQGCRGPLEVHPL
eukprot:CAMPEP_0198561112 /NCGR_PEP_ID=MMETSP1462-20131121/94919_1 /TAXON_ID=1333877 /ORGANISM="Brandtodinium nutriculum, Strain RCC3387" /LENGTH=82 /DNA_ID=CAMNT_0044292001 /DNA_START=65 /DNA_END=309 /DNA_ORIENTATION=-